MIRYHSETDARPCYYRWPVPEKRDSRTVGFQAGPDSDNRTCQDLFGRDEMVCSKHNLRVADDPGVGRRDQNAGLRLAKFYALPRRRLKAHGPFPCDILAGELPGIPGREWGWHLLRRPKNGQPGIGTT